jgi:hypothetical protein
MLLIDSVLLRGDGGRYYWSRVVVALARSIAALQR